MKEIALHVQCCLCLHVIVYAYLILVVVVHGNCMYVCVCVCVCVCRLQFCIEQVCDITLMTYVSRSIRNNNF